MSDDDTNVTKIINNCIISLLNTPSEVAFQVLDGSGIRLARIGNEISVSYYPRHNNEKVIAVVPTGLDTKSTVEWCTKKVLPSMVRHYCDMLETMFATDGIVVEYSGQPMILKCMTVPDNDHIVSIIATRYEYIALCYYRPSIRCSISSEFVRIIADLLQTSRQEREVFLEVNNALAINGLPDIVADYLWFVPKEYKGQIFITDNIIDPDDPISDDEFLSFVLFPDFTDKIMHIFRMVIMKSYRLYGRQNRPDLKSRIILEKIKDYYSFLLKNKRLL